MERVTVVGTGLIGGSIGAALRRHGVEVVGVDTDPRRRGDALEREVVDRATDDLAPAVDGADLVVVAVPVGAVAAAVTAALDLGASAVTDVGSVKGPVVATVEGERVGPAARFVGGHPMAGSEQEGVAGADPDLFVGATWVLTPTGHTDPGVYSLVRSFVALLGAEPVALTPDDHDALVAVVSHVPQLAATTLMDLASHRAVEHAALLRLAAGGFRDMTRIAAGDPAIWPDICVANRDAIVEALDAYLRALGKVRDSVAAGRSDELLHILETARAARRSLPVGAAEAGPLVELRIPVPDRPGVVAEVATLAGRLGVNISDLEIAHSMEGPGGVMVLVVAEAGAGAFEDALIAAGFTVARSPLA